MKKYVVMFTVGAQDMERALDLAREVVVPAHRQDLTVMEADDRDDLTTLAQALAEQPEARSMTWSAEVTCAGWTCRVEFCARSELGSVAFIRGERTEACMVMPAEHMRDLLMGIHAFPYDMIKSIAERGDHACSG
jgi:hypothetical protein